MISNLDRDLFKPILLTLFTANDRKIIEKLQEKDVKCIELNHESRLNFIAFRAKELFDIVNNNKVDIIHTHGFIPDIMSSELNVKCFKVSTLHNIMFEDYANEYGSILFQTYNNFELIIVDDCSKDSTYEIAMKYASKDERISVYRNDKNLKICQTLNKALSYSNGEYILRMDGDDISLPNRLYELKKYLDDNPDISLCGSYMISIDEKGNKLGTRKYPISSKYIEKGNCFVSCVAHIWIARRSIYEALKGYREVPYVEDYDFLLRGELKGFKYANLPQFLYKCRIRKGNTGSTNGLAQRKATKYIQKIHACEKGGISTYSAESFNEAIKSNENEIRKYAKSFAMLDKAVHKKNNLFLCLWFSLISSIYSKYTLVYLINAFRYRLMLRKENREINICK